MAHLNPKPEEVKDKVPEMRDLFQKKFADNISKGVYDERDVDRLMKDEPYACSFLRMLSVKAKPDKALEQIDQCLRFRMEWGINNLTDGSFTQEIWDRNAVYYRGHDKDQHPILYINVKQNNAKGAEEIAETKKFIIHNFEKHHGVNPGQQCVVLMDMTGAGVSNVNMEITKFIIACFTTYFPSFLAYMINYDMPTLLSATWSIISAFLSKAQNEKVRMVKKKDITKFIDPDNLWDHMK